ncbi:ANTAR domain-containing response regulator [Clostridiisalibacter paucivorans]|uniref:ANTAR domain-containing response regulator n=1 Tax=Clostridiisalibacter paucivorans TaxID=408753 RepID=UPI00047EE9C4|nr:ANTAR domain-containing protein [Clostridiisalibacter paucivorans]
MRQYSVVVADSNQSSRKNISNLLMQRGLKTYQATDGGSVLRLVRTSSIDLAIIDVNLLGMNPFEVGDIIEDENLSTVVFMTNNPNVDLFEHMKTMKVYAYITKPVNPNELYHIVEFAIESASKIDDLERKVKRLEDKLEGRKKVDRAKGILMDRLKVQEDDAYKILRKKSMDQCVSIEIIAQKIIEKYS